MYPSNTCEDTSFLGFSDNITANSIITYEGFCSSSLLNYIPPSPIFNYDDAPVYYQHLQEIMHGNGDPEVATHETIDTNMVKIAEDKFCGKSSSADKKKSSPESADNHSQQIRKQDRHSKITTANGLIRGRRMRLSIDVAKDFFALQDMLGYDKASRTVEWLIMKSENAIKEVKSNRVSRTKRSSSPSAPCVILSGIDELEAEAAEKKKMIAVKGSQDLAAIHLRSRELREKARARARKRTQEKKTLQLVGCINSAAAGNTILNMNMNPSDPARVLEKSLNYSKQKSQNFETGKWNPNITIFSHQNSGTKSAEQVADFSNMETTWEVCKN